MLAKLSFRKFKKLNQANFIYFLSQFPRAYYLLHPEGFQLMSLLFISGFFSAPILTYRVFFTYFLCGYNCCFGQYPVITNVGSRTGTRTGPGLQLGKRVESVPRVSEHHKFEISFII